MSEYMLSDPLREFIYRFINFVPNLIAMFIILLAGVAVAALARLVAGAVLRVLRFDSLAQRLEFTKVLARGGITALPSVITTSILYWGMISLSFLLGFVALDLVPVNNLISELFYYLPSVVAAVAIMIVGLVLGGIMERAALVAAGNAGIEPAELPAKGVKLFVILTASFMALDELGIARGIIIAAFSISFGGIVFALALAFGLGARDMAREFLEKRLRKREQDSKEGTDIEL